MKKLLSKMLLVAMGLCAGSMSAWGDPTSIYERGTTTAWASTDVGDGAWSNGTIGTNGLEVTNGVASSLAVSPTSNKSVLTWTATWNPGNATGTANNTNAYISFGDVTFAFYGSSWYTKVTIGGTTTQLTGGGATRERDYIITVTINQTTNEVSYEFNDNGTKITGTGTTASAGSFTTLTHGLGGTSPSWTNTATLKKVEVTEEEYTGTTADYTVKYLCGETEIKESVTRSGEVGSPITLQSTDKETFYNSDNTIKYLYDSDDVSNKTIANDGSTVVSVYFTAATKYTYSVNAVDGDNNNLGTIATSTLYSDETAAVSWSKYIKSGDQWYISTENTFHATSSEAGVKTVVYEKSDIAYFIECEKMNGVRSEANRRTEEYDASWSGNTKIRINRFATTFYTDAFPEGGVFNLTLPYSNSNGSSHTYKTQLRASNGDVTDLDTWECAVSTSNASYTLNNIVVPAGYSIAIYCDGLSNSNANGNARMDYIVLTQTTVTATIGTTGYATFSSTSPLDFTDVSGLTAYIVTGKSGDKVKMQSVTGDMVANTGLVLKGAPGTYKIPVVASSNNWYNADSDPTNYLFAISSDYNLIAANDGKNYVLSVQDNKVVFAPINDVAAPVTAGQAALWLPASIASTRALNISFGDEASGISSIAAETLEKTAIFNLSGQRVSKPGKGLYIVNGKKVMK